MILHQYYLCHHTPSSSGKRLMFLVSFTVALHCKSGFSFSFVVFLFFCFSESGTPQCPKQTASFEEDEKKKEKKKKEVSLYAFCTFWKWKAS